MKLSVALIGNPAFDERTSMDLYAAQLFQALQRVPRHDYRLVGSSLALGSVWAKRLVRYTVWPLQLRRQRADVFHVLDHAYGHLVQFLNRRPTIVTVHDLIPLLRRRGRLGIERGRSQPLNELSFRSLRGARHLIAVSHATKRDLIDLLACRDDQITVIHEGIPDFDNSQLLERQTLRRRWFGVESPDTAVVLTSGAQFYKNTAASVAVVAALRSRGRNCALFRIGVRDRSASHIGGINELGLVDRGLLREIYSAADVLLYPSLYEGFGWPPLEAMQCGLPVVASNRGAIPEVSGDAALLFAPDDVRGMADAIEKVLTDREFRTALITRGFAQSARYSWATTAAATARIYEEMSEGSRSG